MILYSPMIFSQVADLATIHESYQFLMKKYVEEQAPDVQFLTLEDIKKNHKKKKEKKKKDEEDSDDEGPLKVRHNRSR